jgi:hypothetical protein
MPRMRLDYWSCGTLAELHLLAPYVGRPHSLDAAVEAATEHKSRADRAGDSAAILSTRQQLERYTDWWLVKHGYFGGRRDLAEDARVVLAALS